MSTKPRARRLHPHFTYPELKEILDTYKARSVVEGRTPLIASICHKARAAMDARYRKQRASVVNS